MSKKRNKIYWEQEIFKLFISDINNQTKKPGIEVVILEPKD
jgi:hypothetical protein